MLQLVVAKATLLLRPAGGAEVALAVPACSCELSGVLSPMGGERAARERPRCGEVASSHLKDTSTLWFGQPFFEVR